MKRKLLISAAVMLSILLLCGCGKSNAATDADNLIQRIGTVTLDSGIAIQEARDSVDALSSEDLEELEYLEDLEQAEDIYENLLSQEEANDLIERINTLPEEVTLEDNDAVFYVRNLFNRASKQAKELVTNYEELTNAEKQICTLKIDFISEAIESLKSVSLDDKDLIQTAKTYYNSLSQEERDSIPNGDYIYTAAEKLNELEAAEKERKKQETLSGLRSQTDKVTQTTWYFPTNYPQYANSRSYVLPYIGVTEYSTWLRLQYHYTGSNWVFFDNITVAIDDQRYYFTYDYFDVSRDNSGGTVWEWIDHSPSKEELEMLRAIAASDETIVRFQGDTYYYDLTVSQADKQAIETVLDAYDILMQS